MCDSEISESCPTDFSSYCPVNVPRPRLERKKVKTQSRVRKRVVLFSRKGTQYSKSRLSYSSQPSLVPEDWSPDCSSTDEEESSCSLTEFNSKVPPEELSALKGCVSRNRALFSPTPSVDSACIQLGEMRNVVTWPDLISSHETKNFPGRTSPASEDSRIPPLQHHDPGSLTYSVSVQFELDKKNSLGSSVHSSPKHKQSNEQRTAAREFNPDSQEPKYQLLPVSASIPGRLNSPSLRLFCKISHSPSCYSCASAHLSEVVPSNKPPNTPVIRTKSLDEQRPFGIDSTRLYCPLQQYVHPLKAENDTNELSSPASSLRSLSSLVSQEHALKNTYVKGVDGRVFKDRMETIHKWFAELNDQQRNMMLLKLLEECNCVQMHLLSMHMEPLLHNCCLHNCQDLLSWLPSNLAFCILTYLDPVSLCRASQVSCNWYHMASDHRLWMRLCRLCKWQLSQSGEEKHRAHFVAPDGRIMWKAMFAERFRIHRNWLKGFCNVRTFEGHTQGISCIQFDDTRIVSGSWDKTIKVWNRRTNTAWAALTLAGHSGTVRCLHLHGNRLVSGSSDRTIKVWDLATDNMNWVGATCRVTMVGHMHTVRCLQADDTKVISGSYDNTLKVWDLRTGLCSLTLRGHEDAVLCLQFHGNKLVSGSKDTTIKVWNLPTGQCQLTLHGHQAAVTCVQFDDTRIISGALDRLIKIWNISTGQCVQTIDWIRSEGHTGVIRHLQADGWKIVSAADDKTLKVWSVDTGERLLTLKSHTDGVTCLQFNDEVIVSGSYDKSVKLWDFSVC